MGEIAALRAVARDGWADKRLFALVEEGGFWTVHDHGLDGVGPPITYATPQEAVARLMQVMGTGPVEPQSWPEDICVSSVSLGNGGGESGPKVV